MQEQRREVEAQLRQGLLDDDITGQLVTTPLVDTKDLFREHIKKHDKQVMLSLLTRSSP